MSISSRISKLYRRIAENDGITLLTTGLLYLGAIVSVVIGIWASEEWRHPHISKHFLTSSVIVPFILVATSFGLQIVALINDARRRERNASAQSRFLSALDHSPGENSVKRIFLSHLIDEWATSISRLHDGVITVQKDYWKVCAQLYTFSEKIVECTSSVPIEFWDEEDAHGRNAELLAYKASQVGLIKKKIAVRRTFIFEKEPDDQLARVFLRVAIRQLHEEFEVYYLVLSDVRESAERSTLAADFALIDNRVFMLGHQSSTNRGVYHYDFFDLSLQPQNFRLFEDVRRYFVNENVHGELKIKSYRQAVARFPLLQRKDFEAEKQAILRFQDEG